MGIGYQTSVIMLWALIGSIGYAFTWWLASARKRWTAALVIAGCLGAFLPFLMRLPWKFNPRFSTLPVSPVVIERTPETGTANTSPLYPLEGRLITRGLNEDEFVGFHEIIPGRRGASVIQAYLGDRSLESARFNLQRGILWNRTDPLLSHQRLMIDYLSDRLPEPRHFDPPEPTGLLGNWAAIRTDGIEENLQPLDIGQHTWRIRGTVYRWESAGDFPVAEGGWGQLPDEGAVRVMPADPRLAVNMNSLGIRITRPLDFFSIYPRGSRYSDKGHSILTDLPVVLLRDPLDGRVRWLQVHPGKTGQGLASQWENFAASLG